MCVFVLHFIYSIYLQVSNNMATPTIAFPIDKTQ